MHLAIYQNKMYNLSQAEAYQNPGSDPAYVLEIMPVSGGLAAISSDQKLTLFNPMSLSQGPIKTIRTTHGNITCARAFEQANSIVCTAGENGTVALWDLRLEGSKAQIAAPTGQNVLDTFNSDKKAHVAYIHRQ